MLSPLTPVWARRTGRWAAMRVPLFGQYLELDLTLPRPVQLGEDNRLKSPKAHLPIHYRNRELPAKQERAKV